MFYNKFYDENDEWFIDEDHIYERDNSFSIMDYQTSETLVIHPSDYTTDFLSLIYEGKGWDIINDPFLEPEIVEELIETHDRIICLGHGSGGGLFGGMDFLIHDGLVPLLRTKKLVCIWCNADIFMKEHGLKGFFSGMFLSEKNECDLFGIPYEDELQIELSNDLFASVLGKHIDSGGDDILEFVKQEYNDENDPIITFNRNRLYFNGIVTKED